MSAWPTCNMLDALRPDPNQVVEQALLAAYSADPVSIVAALMALVSRDEEDRPASRRDFADAIETLRGKVRIVVQRGRLARPPRTPRLAGVLDQFVREVDFDERWRSWHPKAALVRMAPAVAADLGRRARGKAKATRPVPEGAAAAEWRLWLGSRNLTAPENRDLGLLLVGGGAQGRTVEGAGDIARALADRAELPREVAGRLARAADHIKWRAPRGIRVERLRISQGDGRWPLPDLPAAVDALTLVSPFLDAGFLRHAARPKCPPGERRLLSTVRELERLAASARQFDSLHALDAPDYPVGDLPAGVKGEEAEAEDGSVEGEEIGRGLHAKLLHVRKGASRRFWIGSANATQRAWHGRNVEIVAELTVDEAVEQGLLKLLGEARPVNAKQDEDVEDAEREADVLEAARAEVCARWQGKIAWDDHSLRLEHPDPPHPDDPGIGIDIGLITGDLQPWPRGRGVLDFGSVPPADRTELLQIRLTNGGRSCAWILRAQAAPAFDVARDRAAFMRLMGAREFLLWIADLLRGVAAEDDGPSWDDETRAAPGREAVASAWTDGLPTLEEMLAAWTRDSDAFARIGERVRAYLPALMAHAAQEGPGVHDALARFEALWRTLEGGLRKQA